MIFTAIDYDIVIASVDLSDHISQVDMPLDADKLVADVFGNDGWHDNRAGMFGAALTIAFFQDYDAAEVDATLWPLFIARTPVAVTVKPTTGGLSATNPGFSGNFVPLQYVPIAAKVGDLAAMTLTWPNSGAISRLVA